jgi:hypothetical protein
LPEMLVVALPVHCGMEQFPPLLVHDGGVPPSPTRPPLLLPAPLLVELPLPELEPEPDAEPEPEPDPPLDDAPPSAQLHGPSPLPSALHSWNPLHPPGPTQPTDAPGVQCELRMAEPPQLAAGAMRVARASATRP